MTCGKLVEGHAALKPNRRLEEGGEHHPRRLRRPHAERGMIRHHALGLTTAAACMMMHPANAIDTMESDEVLGLTARGARPELELAAFHRNADAAAGPLLEAGAARFAAMASGARARAVADTL